jgi:hypothetical protein
VTLLVFLFVWLGESTANCLVREEARLGMVSCPAPVLLNEVIDRYENADGLF